MTLTLHCETEKTNSTATSAADEWANMSAETINGLSADVC
jgi:hypothetical protein